ncbi:MAG: hypothetical protein R6W70_03955, partial [bacterium]
LSQKQVAHALGYRNVNKGIRRIQHMESGVITESLVIPICNLLDIPPAARDDFLRQDCRREMRRRKELPPFKPRLIRRVFAACYIRVALPDRLTTESARIRFSSRFAADRQNSCCLMTDYNLRYWFTPTGEYHIDRKWFGGPALSLR